MDKEGISLFRETYLQVDLSAIRHNVKAFADMARVPVAAVVKADAYGHGAVPVAKAALEAGAKMLAVALVEEGVTLREAGITAPILTLGLTGEEGLREGLLQGLTLCVCTMEQIKALGSISKKLRMTAHVHLKLDTGMGRIGVRTPEQAAQLYRCCMENGVLVDGVFTHFATADVPQRQEYVRCQADRLLGMLAALRQAGFNGIVHASASAASILNQDLRFDMVREGISLYGTDISGKLGLRPALTWKTKIVYLKSIADGESVSYGQRFFAQGERRIATLPVGYADGYRRAMAGKAQALVRGQRVPVVGTICMDQIMLDVTDVADAAIGDEVVLMGAQGKDVIADTELAQWADTINYEIMTGISARVPRVYLC